MLPLIPCRCEVIFDVVPCGFPEHPLITLNICPLTKKAFPLSDGIFSRAFRASSTDCPGYTPQKINDRPLLFMFWNIPKILGSTIISDVLRALKRAMIWVLSIWASYTVPSELKRFDNHKAFSGLNVHERTFISSEL